MVRAIANVTVRFHRSAHVPEKSGRSRLDSLGIRVVSYDDYSDTKVTGCPPPRPTVAPAFNSSLITLYNESPHSSKLI